MSASRLEYLDLTEVADRRRNGRSQLVPTIACNRLSMLLLARFHQLNAIALAIWFSSR